MKNDIPDKSEKKEKKSFCFFLCSSSSKKKKSNSNTKDPAIEFEVEKKDIVKSNSATKYENKKDDSLKSNLQNKSNDKKHESKTEIKKEPINISKQYNTSKHLEKNEEFVKNKGEHDFNLTKKVDLKNNSKIFEKNTNDESPHKINNTQIIIPKNFLNCTTMKDIPKENLGFKKCKYEIEAEYYSHRSNNKNSGKRNIADLNIDMILIEENNKYNSNNISNHNKPTNNLNNVIQKQINKNETNLMSNKSISIKRRVSNQVVQNVQNEESIEDVIIEDEFKPDSNESANESIFNKSIISSNILSHINTPKLFTNMKNDMSYCSIYMKSENSRCDTLFNDEILRQANPMMSSLKPFSQTAKQSTDFTEFEVINENDRFNRYLETPKASTLKNTNNPNIKNLYEKLHKKERAIKHFNEKINKMMNEIKIFEEENKKICNKIEKEEAEAERLRHLLNFLILG